MCGVAAVLGPNPSGRDAAELIAPIVAALGHRGPDATATWTDRDRSVAIGHTRLAIVDRSPTGAQPMRSPDGRFVLAYNGEIYNAPELRAELAATTSWRFAGSSDTEVLLAAFVHWGPACLHRLVGMFAFVVWDDLDHRLFAARDRFGVKPLHLHRTATGGLVVASEVAALQAAGIGTDPDPRAWASYLADGRMAWPDRTFWRDVAPLPAGHVAQWQDGQLTVRPWYRLDAAVAAAGPDGRSEDAVLDEYEALVRESVRLRFRADVPVGIAISGGLDSSLLLALVDALGPDERAVHAFTFTTGDPAYDELPWVEALVAGTAHPLHECRLRVDDVPALASELQRRCDGPFGGVPTIAYAQLFRRARELGVTVVLDGQGMDEQWAGYDYYRALGSDAIVQGAASPATRPAVLGAALRDVDDLGLGVDVGFGPDAERVDPPPGGELDPLTRAQIRDLTEAKLPRALRFNDRASMRSSCELREPFLDHRLVELALRQPIDRKVDGRTGKVLLRRLARERLVARDVAAPKRPVQTPQREWLRGPLEPWVREAVADGLAWQPDWLDPSVVADEIDAFLGGYGDNSFFVWQWLSLGLTARLT